MKNSREENIRNLLSLKQIQLTYRFLCANRRYKTIDKNGPLLNNPGYKECAELLRVLRQEMRNILNELTEDFGENY